MRIKDRRTSQKPNRVGGIDEGDGDTSRSGGGKAGTDDKSRSGFFLSLVLLLLYLSSVKRRNLAPGLFLFYFYFSILILLIICSAALL